MMPWETLGWFFFYGALVHVEIWLTRTELWEGLMVRVMTGKGICAAASGRRVRRAAENFMISVGLAVI